MASVSTPNLDVEIQNDNRQLNVDYTITFDAFDQASQLSYKHVTQVIGDDTNVAGDPSTVAPDDVLETIINDVVQANGATSLPVTIQHVVGKSKLNEDTGSAFNPDEIRVKVTLTPILPLQIVRESNLYLESIN